MQIFTGVVDRDYISKLLKNLIKLLPSAHIIGATTDGEICSGRVSTKKTVLSFTQFEKTQLHTTLVEGHDDCYECGKAIADTLSAPSVKVIISFVEGLGCNGEAYLDGIHSVDESLLVAGGLSGDNGQFNSTYVFTKEKILSKASVAVALSNPDLFVHTDYSFDWLSIGKQMKITKVENNRVYTIDNIPAYDVYKKYLGDEVAKLLPSIGVEFPLIIQKGDNQIARAVLTKHDDGSLSFAGNIKLGEYVTFGYGDAEMILNHSKETQNNITDFPIESIFIYSCMARRRFMPEHIESEIMPFQALVEVSGFFTYGEFFSFGSKKELFNQTMTVLGLSESSNKITKQKDIEEVSLVSSEYQKTIKSLTHLLNITTRELAQDNEALVKSKRVLEVSKESLKQAQEISHIGRWEVDLLRDVTTWSDENYRIYGVDPESVELSREFFFSLIVEEDRKKVKEAIASMKDGSIHSAEVGARRMDGTLIRLFTNGKFIFNENGDAIKMAGTTQDITHMRAIEHKEQQQAQILDQIHDSVVSTDLDDIIIHWNNGATLIHGYLANEMLGKSIKKLYHAEDMEKFQWMKDQTLKLGSYQGQIRKMTKDGSIIYTDVSLSVLKNEDAKIIGITRYSQDITQKKLIEDQLNKQTERLDYQAHYDSLTKLPNRVLFNDSLKETIKNAHKNNVEFALLFLDLDNFKQINDTLGHHYGDMVLKIVAKRFLKCITRDDMLSRIGGDEFTVLLSSENAREVAIDVAKKIIKSMKPVVILGNHEFYLSVSIGISLYPNDAVKMSELLKYADTAMYHAKNEGRDNYKFYNEDMTRFALEKANMEKHLYNAIKEKQLIPYYQPQIDARDNTIMGMEALVRWEHPELGFISPDRFIPLAEEIGLIIELDNLVMYQAMRDIKHWYEEGLNPGVLSLNLSIAQLKSNDFINRLKMMIEDTGLDAKYLELEVTESIMMDDPVKSIEILQILGDMGINIAIDDFGTGYSSLAYLKKLPVSKLKIDQSFVRELPYNDDDRVISKTIIALAQNLNMEIIAEGVETKEQLDYLVSNGCYHIQGYYYSKAIGNEAMNIYIKANEAASSS